MSMRSTTIVSDCRGCAGTRPSRCCCFAFRAGWFVRFRRTRLGRSGRCGRRWRDTRHTWLGMNKKVGKWYNMCSVVPLLEYQMLRPLGSWNKAIEAIRAKARYRQIGSRASRLARPRGSSMPRRWCIELCRRRSMLRLWTRDTRGCCTLLSRCLGVGGGLVR